MSIAEKDVAYVAELANLELTAAERDRMVRDLNSILDYIAMLNELDTANVEPMAQVTGHLEVEAGKASGARLANAMREDVVTPAAGEPAGADDYSRVKRSLPHDAALANAPESDGTFFQVPKVIER